MIPALPDHERVDRGTAHTAVQSWNGVLYLVYLPMHRAYAEGRRTTLGRDGPAARRERLTEIGRTLGIRVIDIEADFLRAGAGAEAYVYPYRAHFTSAGYTAAGNAIVARLEADRAENGLPGPATVR